MSLLHLSLPSPWDTLEIAAKVASSNLAVVSIFRRRFLFARSFSGKEVMYRLNAVVSGMPRSETNERVGAIKIKCDPDVHLAVGRAHAHSSVFAFVSAHEDVRASAHALWRFRRAHENPFCSYSCSFF